MTDTKVTVTDLMAKPTANELLRAFTTLAIVLVVPVLLSAQQPSISPASGPHTALDVHFLTPLPSAPDAEVSSAATKPFGNAEMLAIRPVEITAPRERAVVHRFWDRENTMLFAASAGWAAADFYVTQSNLASGGRELNPIARAFTGSTPALAANFALETSGVVGISYFFHKTGHHKLERATSYVNISASAGAVLYGLTHR